MRLPLLNSGLVSILSLLTVNSMLTTNSNNSVTFYSFSAAHNRVNPNFSQRPVSIIVVSPNFNNADCSPDMSSIPKFSNSSKAENTAIMIFRTPQCSSVLKPLSFLNDMVVKLQQNSYPNVVSILWPVRIYDRVILGAPGSELDNFSPSIIDSMNYQIVTDTSFSDYALNNPNAVYTLYNEANPWSMDQMSFNVLSWKSAIQAVKLLLFVISIVAFGCVASRSRLKGKLQLSLLLTALLLLGGDLVFSWCNVTDIRYQFYQLFLLLPCLFSNLFAVLSWTTIVLRLKLIPIKTFRVAIIIESMLLTAALFVLIAWLYLDKYQAGNLTYWYGTVLYIVLGFLVSIPVFIIAWFISKAHNFCPLFFTIAKLINGQRLTMYILMTRIIFMLVLTSTFLNVFFVKSFDNWVSFSLFNNISLVFYMVITLLTVNKFQSIQTASFIMNSMNQSQQDDITMQPTHETFLADKIAGTETFNMNAEQFTPHSSHTQPGSHNGSETPEPNMNINGHCCMGNNAHLGTGIHF